MIYVVEVGGTENRLPGYIVCVCTVCKIDITNLVLNSKYDNVKVHGAEATNPSGSSTLPTTRGVTDLYRNCGRLLVNVQDEETISASVCSKLQVSLKKDKFMCILLNQ